MPESELVRFRCPTDLKRALEHEAELEYRTLSNWLVAVLSEEIERRRRERGE